MVGYTFGNAQSYSAISAKKWGTEVARTAWHDDTWIASLENKLHKTTNDIVITDVRFPNEIRAIKNAGGIVIRVVRGPEPEWYDLAVKVNAGPKGPLHSGSGGWELAKTELNRYGVHPSEWAWIGTDFDAVINNNADGLDALFAQVKHLVSNLQDARANPPL